MVIDGKDYRTTTITDANGSAANLVPPTPNTPDRPSDLDVEASTQDDYAAYAVFEKVSSSQYGDALIPMPYLQIAAKKLFPAEVSRFTTTHRVHV